MRRLVGVLVFLAFLLPGVSDVSAMPSFSRKLGADCTHCHTQVPKLNRTGYEYRLAGYRDPADIGAAEKKFELGDFPAVGSPFFLWNLDEMAVEVGYYHAKFGTSIAARVSNGIIWKEGTNPPGTAEPAQGGSLTKTQGQPGANRKNYEVFVNQFITNDSALSLYYYNGTVPFPDPGYAATTDVTLDTFQRLTGYGNFWVWPGKVNLLAGYAFGDDSLDNAAVKSSDGKYKGSNVGKSHGFFGEVNYQALPKLLLGARYDVYNPSNKVANNNQKAWTVSGPNSRLAAIKRTVRWLRG